VTSTETVRVQFGKPPPHKEKNDDQTLRVLLIEDNPGDRT